MDREREEYYEKRYGNPQRRFFCTGMQLDRALQHIDEAINDVFLVEPYQPTNREISSVLEDLRQVRRRLAAEYERLVDENMKNTK